MSTTYYLHIDVCECCKRPWKIYEIGTVSNRFFHHSPELAVLGIPSLSVPGNKIFDECNREISVDEMINIMKNNFS